MNIKVQAKVFRYFLKISYYGNKIERRIILTDITRLNGEETPTISDKSIKCSSDIDNDLYKLKLNNGDMIEFEAELVSASKKASSYFRNISNIRVVKRHPIAKIQGFEEGRNPFNHTYCTEIQSNVKLDDDELFLAYKSCYYGYELSEGEFILQ